MISDRTFYGFGRTLTSGVLTRAVLKRSRVLIIPADAAFDVVTLPDARTMELGGPHAFVVNLTAGAVAIKNADGTLVKTLLSGSKGRVLLSNNTTTAGHWFVLTSTNRQRASRSAVASAASPTLPSASCVTSLFRLTDCLDSASHLYTNTNLSGQVSKVVTIDGHAGSFLVEGWNAPTTGTVEAVTISRTLSKKKKIYNSCLEAGVATKVKLKFTDNLVTGGRFTAQPSPPEYTDSLVIEGTLYFKTLAEPSDDTTYASLSQLFCLQDATNTFTFTLGSFDSVRYYFPVKNGKRVHWAGGASNTHTTLVQTLACSLGDMVQIGLDYAADGVPADIVPTYLNDSARQASKLLYDDDTAGADGEQTITSAAMEATYFTFSGPMQVYADSSTPWRIIAPAGVTVSPSLGTGSRIVYVDLSGLDADASKTGTFRWTTHVLGETTTRNRTLVFTNTGDEPPDGSDPITGGFPEFLIYDPWTLYYQNDFTRANGHYDDEPAVFPGDEETNELQMDEANYKVFGNTSLLDHTFDSDYFGTNFTQVPSNGWRYTGNFTIHAFTNSHLDPDYVSGFLPSFRNYLDINQHFYDENNATGIGRLHQTYIQIYSDAIYVDFYDGAEPANEHYFYLTYDGGATFVGNKDFDIQLTPTGIKVMFDGVVAINHTWTSTELGYRGAWKGWSFNDFGAYAWDSGSPRFLTATLDNFKIYRNILTGTLGTRPAGSGFNRGHSAVSGIQRYTANTIANSTAESFVGTSSINRLLTAYPSGSISDVTAGFDASTGYDHDYIFVVKGKWDSVEDVRPTFSFEATNHDYTGPSTVGNPDNMFEEVAYAFDFLGWTLVLRANFGLGVNREPDGGGGWLSDAVGVMTITDSQGHHGYLPMGIVTNNVL